MIVTAGRHQAPMILAARRMGCEVLATDADPNAASLPLADRTAVVSATDRAALLGTAREFRADAILTEQTDIAVPAVAYVAEALGLPGIGYEAAMRATDKWAMRTALTHAGVAVPKFALATSVADAVAAAERIGLPVVIKPADNQASRGVTRVDEPVALQQAAERALTASRSGRVLVEELLVGTERSVESFVSDGRVTILGVGIKQKSAPPYCFDLQLDYGDGGPDTELTEIASYNERVIAAVGLSSGFAHAEMVVTRDGVRLIEVAARSCGARVVSDLLPRLTGIDLLGARIRQALGEAVALPPVVPKRAGILRFLELPEGVIRRIAGTEEAAAEPGVVHFDFAARVGDRLRRPVSGDQRPGFVLAAAETAAEAAAVAARAIGRLEVDLVAA
jgi:biotin carboxylase